MNIEKITIQKDGIVEVHYKSGKSRCYHRSKLPKNISDLLKLRVETPDNMINRVRGV